MFVSTRVARFTKYATWSFVSPSPFRSVPAGPKKPSLAKYTIESPASTIGAAVTAAWLVVESWKLESPSLPLPQAARAEASRTGRNGRAGETVGALMGTGRGGRGRNGPDTIPPLRSAHASERSPRAPARIRPGSPEPAETPRNRARFAHNVGVAPVSRPLRAQTLLLLGLLVTVALSAFFLWRLRASTPRGRGAPAVAETARADASLASEEP